MCFVLCRDGYVEMRITVKIYGLENCVSKFFVFDRLRLFLHDIYSVYIVFTFCIKPFLNQFLHKTVISCCINQNSRETAQPPNIILFCGLKLFRFFRYWKLNVAEHLSIKHSWSASFQFEYAFSSRCLQIPFFPVFLARSKFFVNFMVCWPAYTFAGASLVVVSGRISHLSFLPFFAILPFHFATVII